MGRNLLAGFADSSWSVVVELVAVPFYLKYLGIESYGLIGFFVTTRALLYLLDMGMTPTISREVARCSAQGGIEEAGRLLHTLAIIYWSVAALVALFLLVSAPWIAENWLNLETLSLTTVSNAVILMGLVIAFRMPMGLYQGALIGAQRLTVSSGINMAMVAFGGFGAVIILAFVSPTIQAFFIWQACVGLVFSFVMRYFAWRVIGKTNGISFDVVRLRSIWRFTLGMSGVAISGIILVQLDKVLLSKIIGLDDFGRYALAAMAARGLYVFLTPLFNTIYPRMSALVATGNTDELVTLYRSGTLLFLSLFFPVAVSVAVFSEELLYLWTGDQSVAMSTAPIVSLFVIGTAFNGVMHFPYALQLAYGEVRLPLKINAILIVAMIPTIIFLAMLYGAVGGAAAWALTNFLYIILGTWLTHRSLLKGIGAKWLFGDVVTPLVVAVLVVGVGGRLIKEYGYPFYVNLLIDIGLMCMAFMFLLTVSSKLRESVRIVISAGR